MNHLPIHTHHQSSYLCACKPLHLSRTLYKSPPVMQNKPNFPHTRTDLTLINISCYENPRLPKACKNKPNQPHPQPPHPFHPFEHSEIFTQVPTYRQPAGARFTRQSPPRTKDVTFFAHFPELFDQFFEFFPHFLQNHAFSAFLTRLLLTHPRAQPPNPRLTLQTSTTRRTLRTWHFPRRPHRPILTCQVSACCTSATRNNLRGADRCFEFSCTRHF